MPQICVLNLQQRSMRIVFLLTTLLVTTVNAERPVQKESVGDLDRRVTHEVDAQLRRIDLFINDSSRYRSELKLLLESVSRVPGISDRVRRANARRIINRIPPVCELLAQDSIDEKGFPKRRWTDKKAQYLLEASFAQLNADRTVLLKTADDLTRIVPLERLSDVDLDYLVSLQPACGGLHPFVTRTSDCGKYVELSAGKDDGVVADGVWEIWRGPTPLKIRGRTLVIWRKKKVGRVRIVRTNLDSSIARITESSQKFRKGDIAVHQDENRSD